MTDDEIAQTTELLKKLEPGFLPYTIFQQITRLFAAPILELVPLRRSTTGDVEVLLLDRGPLDDWWPNKLHTPGVVIRADDINPNTYDSSVAYARLVRDELADTPLGPPHFVCNMLQKSKRGTEQAQVYYVEVTGENQVGDFYPVSELPDRLIAEQESFIRMAAAAFQTEGAHD